MTVTKHIIMTMGDASDGKTTVSRAALEAGGFLHNPRIRFLDADEKAGLSKYSDIIEQADVRNFDDFAAIEILLRSLDAVYVDMPGTSKTFTRDAISDPAGLAELGLLITPILLVGARGTSFEEAEAWLQLMKGLPLGFIIYNPKKAVREAQIESFTTRFLNEKLPGPKKRVIIHLPPLEASIAKELERMGVPLADIIEGKILPAESEILSLNDTRIRTGRWKKAVFAALQPLLTVIETALKNAEKPIEK